MIECRPTWGRSVLVCWQSRWKFDSLFYALVVYVDKASPHLGQVPLSKPFNSVLAACLDSSILRDLVLGGLQKKSTPQTFLTGSGAPNILRFLAIIFLRKSSHSVLSSAPICKASYHKTKNFLIVIFSSGILWKMWNQRENPSQGSASSLQFNLECNCWWSSLAGGAIVCPALAFSGHLVSIHLHLGACPGMGLGQTWAHTAHLGVCEIGN